jgi:hypothetical protein
VGLALALDGQAQLINLSLEIRKRWFQARMITEDGRKTVDSGVKA